MRVSVAPARTALLSPHVNPKTWNNGRQPITTSSGPSLTSVRPLTSALRPRLAWVNVAPLGLPVVPDVCRMTATSSSSRGTGEVWAGRSAIRSASAASSTIQQCAPASAAPAVASSAKAGVANMALAAVLDR